MPKLCAAGCGFFSNPNLDDLCSKCNRERQANEAAAKAIASSAPPAVVATPQQLPPVVPAAMQLPAAVTVPAVVAVQPQPQTRPAQQPAAPVQMPVPAPAAVAEPAVSPVATPQPAQQPLSAKLQLPEAQDTPSAAAAAAADSGGSQLQAAAPDEAADEEPPRRVQKNTSRCFSCNKKIGLTGFKCRCGFVFCGPHRLAEAHACDYDYKSNGRETLAKLNPLVQADRITRF